MGLTPTLILLAVEFLILAFCMWQARKPSIPGHPRLVPYRFISLMLIVIMLATLAHAVALITGNPVVPRRKFGT